MLPKNIRPEYTTTLPSTGRKITYQPFSVREEKVLVLAAESNDPDQISTAIIRVLGNCVTSPADFKVDDITLFDIEYLFLKCRAKSAGEKIKLMVTDPSDETYTVPHEINIDKIKVIKTEGHTNLIDITDDTKVQMSYPDIDFFTEGVQLDTISASIKSIARCVKSIIIGEEVYNSADMSTQEVEDWVEGLTTSQLAKVVEFFNSMPKLSHEFTLKNKNTGKDFTIKLEGLADFF